MSTLGYVFPVLPRKRTCLRLSWANSPWHTCIPGMHHTSTSYRWFLNTRLILLCSIYSLFSCRPTIKAEPLQIVNCGISCWCPCGPVLFGTWITTVMGRIRGLACGTERNFRFREELRPRSGSKYNSVNTSDSFTSRISCIATVNSWTSWRTRKRRWHGRQ